MTEQGDGSSGSTLGGFGHADSIEPGALDEAIEEHIDKPDQIEVPELPDPEGLVGAHDEVADDHS
jgi:hypothetical protein